MNEPTRIVAIRHGETTWNVDTRIQGHLDIPLNATGRQQAARMARALQGEPIAAVYASDLTRAWETAGYLGRAQGLDVTAEEGLRERGFGDFEGKTFAEIEALLPDQSLRQTPRRADCLHRSRRCDGRALPRGHAAGHSGAPYVDAGQRRHQPPALDA